jgi:hypothetical protein
MASSATENIIIGVSAARQLSSGDQNIFIGANAGPSVTSGSQNILIGNQAGLNISGGSRNILIGENSGGIAALGSDNIGLGRDISIPGSNNCLIGLNIGTAIGTKRICVVGIDNTNVNGSNITLVGKNIYTSGPGASNISAIGQDVIITGTTLNNSVSLLNGTNSASLLGNGDFVVSGQAYKAVAGAWLGPSDARLKSNIHMANTILCENILKNLNLKRYTWNEDFNPQVTDRSQLGFIAQEVEEYLPKSISIAQHAGIDDCRLIDLSQIHMIMYGALKRSIERIDELEAILARNNLI